jgi:hypothetical protein
VCVCVCVCVCAPYAPKFAGILKPPPPACSSVHVPQRNSESRSLSALRVSSIWMNGRERRNSESLESTGSPRGTETAMDSLRAREPVSMRVASPRGSDERNGHRVGELPSSPAWRDSNVYRSILAVQSPTRPEVQMSTRPGGQLPTQGWL